MPQVSAPPLLKQILERRLEIAAAISGLLIQALVWAATGPQLTATQHAHQAALCALWTTALVVDVVLPQRTWERCRCACGVIARLHTRARCCIVAHVPYKEYRTQAGSLLSTTPSNGCRTTTPPFICQVSARHCCTRHPRQRAEQPLHHGKFGLGRERRWYCACSRPWSVFC